MRRFIIGLVLFLILAFPPGVYAAQTMLGKNMYAQKVISLPAGEVVEGDFFAAGETVEIYGTVNGDVYAAGGQIQIDGIINGDLLVAGGTVTINGIIAEDIRSAGGSILFGGQTEGNITAVGGNIQFLDSSHTVGNVVTGAGNVIFGGVVEGNIKAGVGNLTIANSIGGDVEAGVGNLRATSQATVGGDLTYWSEEPAQLDPSAIVEGETIKHDVPRTKYSSPSRAEVRGAIQGVNIFLAFISLISSLILGLLMIHLMPNYMRNVVITLKSKTGTSLLVGVLALILVPMGVLVMFATVFTIPLAVILLFVFFIYLYIARLFAILALGMWLTEITKTKTLKLGWVFIIGLFIYYLLGFIPILGWLAKGFIIVAGLGAGLLNKRAWYATARKAKIL